MGRLFWKIFLIILLGHVTAISTMSLVNVIWRPEPHQPDMRKQIEQDVQLVHQTVKLIREQGIHAVSNVALYVIDEKGNDVNGKTIDPIFLNGVQLSHQNIPSAPHIQEVESQGKFYLVFPPGPEQRGLQGVHEYPSVFVWFMSNLAIVLMIIVSLGYAIFLAWYLSKPITVLRQAFTQAASGNLNTQSHINMGNRRDELADLGREFDRMAEQLQKLMEEKRRLLHDISHELRSPLARLQLAIDLANQQSETSETTLKRIELESKRMDKLIGELLTLSKLENGAQQFPREEIDLDELVNDIVNDASFEAQGQNKQVILHGSLERNIYGNADLLRRALENVIRNAIKYTAEETVVSVDVSRQGNQLSVMVSDQGTGVPEAELQHIFEPFFRSHNQSKKRTGFGLGLAICRGVIEMHGGTIQARNRTGGGLQVLMMFPAV